MFKYDKATGKIVQQQVKKVPIMRSNPLSILTQTPVIGKVIEDPLSIAFVGTTFSNAMEQNNEKFVPSKPRAGGQD
jgi:hypothetical protein